MSAAALGIKPCTNLYEGCHSKIVVLGHGVPQVTVCTAMTLVSVGLHFGSQLTGESVRVINAG